MFELPPLVWKDAQLMNLEVTPPEKDILLLALDSHLNGIEVVRDMSQLTEHAKLIAKAQEVADLMRKVREL